MRRLERDAGGAAEHDDAGEEAIRVVADQARAQAREEPEKRERGAGEQRRPGARVVEAEQERGQRESDVDEAECRDPLSRHAAKLQHRGMKPTLVRYEAPSWGIGEVWLDGDVVVWSELPRNRPVPNERGLRDVSETYLRLVRRLQGFFAGEADPLADVPLALEDGFYGDCAGRFGPCLAARW